MKPWVDFLLPGIGSIHPHDTHGGQLCSLARTTILHAYNQRYHDIRSNRMALYEENHRFVTAIDNNQFGDIRSPIGDSGYAKQDITLD